MTKKKATHKKRNTLSYVCSAFLSYPTFLTKKKMDEIPYSMSVCISTCHIKCVKKREKKKVRVSILGNEIFTAIVIRLILTIVQIFFELRATVCLYFLSIFLFFFFLAAHLHSVTFPFFLSRYSGLLNG